MNNSEEVIYGRNAVTEAIKSGMAINKILISSGEISGSLRAIIGLAKANHIVYQFVDKNKLNELSGSKNHQGVLLYAAAGKYCEIDDLLTKAKEAGEPPFLLLLDEIQDPHNFGAIIRSAEALGAHGVITLKRKSASLTAAACKTACGAEEFIPVIKVNNLSQTIDQLKQRGVWVACADMDGDDAVFTDLKGPLMIVIGAEGEGVSRLVKEKSDFVIKIGLKGNIQSLNASAAAAILMYERERQLLTAQNKK